MENNNSLFKRFIVRMISAFEESHVQYAIIGGVAGICYGIGRTTRDVDTILLVEVEETAVRLYRKLGQYHFSLPPKPDFIKDILSQTPIRCEDTKSEYFIDLFGVIDEIEREIIEKRKKHHIFCQDTWIAPIEPLIILKLRAGRPKDISDATELILSNQASLQWNYLRTLAEQNNVSDELALIVNELP